MRSQAKHIKKLCVLLSVPLVEVGSMNPYRTITFSLVALPDQILYFSILEAAISHAASYVKTSRGRKWAYQISVSQMTMKNEWMNEWMNELMNRLFFSLVGLLSNTVFMKNYVTILYFWVPPSGVNQFSGVDQLLGANTHFSGF